MAAKGSYRKQSEGSWEIRISLGKNPVTKKYDVYRETFYGTEPECKAYLEEKVYEFRHGKKPGQNNITVIKYLDYWIKNYVEPSLKHTTARGYKETIKNHIIPYINPNLKLKDFTPLHVEQHYNRLRETGTSPHIMKDVHTVWGSSMERAYIWGYIPVRFKIDRVEAVTKKERIRIKAQTKKKIVWNADQTFDFLTWAEYNTGRRYYIYLIAFTTGIRRGENLALKWSEVNFNEHYIRIAASITDNVYEDYVKTEKSVDDIYMVSFLEEKLKQYKTTQEIDRANYKRAYSNDNWVHAKPLGDLLMRPDTVPEKFNQDLIQFNYERIKNGREPLPRMVFHDLRHTLATLLYEKFQVSWNVIGEILRHRKPQVAGSIPIASSIFFSFLNFKFASN